MTRDAAQDSSTVADSRRTRTFAGLSPLSLFFNLHLAVHERRERLRMGKVEQGMGVSARTSVSMPSSVDDVRDDDNAVSVPQGRK